MTVNSLIDYEVLLLKAANAKEKAGNDFGKFSKELTNREQKQLNELGYVTGGFYVDEKEGKVVATYAFTEAFERWHKLLKKSTRSKGVNKEELV